jgi:hypothetical protein
MSIPNSRDPVNSAPTPTEPSSAAPGTPANYPRIARDDLVETLPNEIAAGWADVAQ